MSVIQYSPPENRYIQLDIAFATEYGTNEAIIFAKLYRLQKEWTGFTDEKGNKWIRLTYDEWENELPFISRNTIIRTLESMETKKLTFSTVFKGRSKWYRCNPDFVSTQNGYLPKMGKTSTQNGQLPNSLPNSSFSSSFQEEESVPPQNPKKSSKEKNLQPIKEKKARPKVSPPPVKPKTSIKDKFCELTNRKMPKNKKQCGYWWSQFGEILYLANDDYELACKALEEVVPYMRAHNLSISGPQSVVGLCGEVLAGQKLNGNGANGQKQQSSLAGLSKYDGHIKKRVDLNAPGGPRTYYYDTKRKCEVPAPV